MPKNVTKLMNREELIAPFADCLSWCFRISNKRPENVPGAFRSGSLARSALRVLPPSLRSPYEEPDAIWDEVRKTPEIAFAEFLEARRQLINEQLTRKISFGDMEAELTRSRVLLLSSWERSLSDGLAESETSGFLDKNNLPPWDTWLALVSLRGKWSERCLISWVPSWISESVDSAIGVNAEACLAWAYVSGENVFAKQWGRKWNP